MTKPWTLICWAMAGLALTACAELDATAGVEPPPAEGRTYPNLAVVPRPPPAPAPAAHRAELGGLIASRDAVLREEEQLRAIDPGRGLPPPRPRAAPSASGPTTPTSPAPAVEGAQEAAPEAPAPPPRAAAVTPRPQLPRSLFMGTVMVPDRRGPLADFQRKVLEDSVAMAKRTNGRIRLVGGLSAEDRQRVADELVQLGIAANRIVSAAEKDAPPRPPIDVLVEN